MDELASNNDDSQHNPAPDADTAEEFASQLTWTSFSAPELPTVPMIPVTERGLDNRMKTQATILATLSISLLAGCASTRPSPVTLGAAKMYLHPGETHQVDVIEKFGTPNIVTRRDGGEMWVYDKVSSSDASGALGLGGLGGGGSGGGFGGGGIFGGLSSRTRSETTVMLIVYFDANDIVLDYKITQTKF